jgi:hypothetical protein
MFVTPVGSIAEALGRAADKLGRAPRTYVLPQGGLVFPWIEGQR